VLRPGAAVTPAALPVFLAPKIARWWNPETYAFVAAIPKTGIGKVDKKVLRERLARGELEVVQVPGVA
jgi:fatty-acyl-CoA synthase